MNFRTQRQREREREREGESKKREHRWFAQPSFSTYHRTSSLPSQALAQTPITNPSSPPSQALAQTPITNPSSQPTLPHHQSTNTQDPPLRSPCISFSSSPLKTDLILDPPKIDLVVAAEDRSLFPDLSLFSSISQSFSL